MSECHCNEKFRSAEDYRDHLPCQKKLLAFSDLTRGNKERIPLYLNGKGELAHPPIEGKPPGADWSILEWSGAAAGELGEMANLAKKVRRGDVSLDDVIEDKGKMMKVRDVIAREVADVVCYLDIICIQVGADLGEAVREKFNSVSDRIGVSVKI